MKKLVTILLAVMMLGVFACAAWAENAPQPEAGKKFESDWAIGGGLAQIRYEEAGYKVFLEIVRDDGTGSVWQYSCSYEEDTDSLASVSSMRQDYTIDPDTLDRVFGEAAYDDFDDENTVTKFTVDGDGFLIWKDGRDDAGARLKFADIGAFDGKWENTAEEVSVEFIWNGATADELFYTVYILRGTAEAEHYSSFIMNGTYDPATGKLTADGICMTFTKNASGEYDASDDGEIYDAVFSRLDNGGVLYETANGIELEPVMEGSRK